MRFAFPQWKGFESAPEGHLLDQLVDLSGSLGIAYERSVGFYKDFHTHDRPMIVLPRGACVVNVRIATAARRYDVDNASLLIVPSGLEHEDEGLTSIFDTVALYPSTSLLDRVAEEEEFAPTEVRRFFNRCQKLPRGRWLEQLLQEYFFARVVARRESAQTLAFFERQILVELLTSALGRSRAAVPGPAALAGENVTSRALRYIESNLFSKLPLGVIARRAFTSPSTLLRQFRHDTGTSPHGYVKARRLEEARRLIEARTHPVGEVALLVGYESFGSFSTAFKKQFGRPPSSFQDGPDRPPTRSGPPRRSPAGPSGTRSRAAKGRRSESTH